MNDFFQTKIGIALALLAALFSLWPLIEKSTTVIFALGGVSVSIKFAYFSLLVLYGLAVYLFAIQFALNKPIALAGRIANAVYVIAISAPGFYLMLWLVSFLIVTLSSAPTIELLPSSLSIIGLISAILVWLIQSVTYFRKVKSADAHKARTKEIDERTLAIDRYKSLVEAGYFDLAVVETFKTVEYLIRTRSHDDSPKTRRIPLWPIIDTLIEKSILKEDDKGIIRQLMDLRNKAVHDKIPITRTEAENASFLAQHILLSLEASEDSSEQEDA